MLIFNDLYLIIACRQMSEQKNFASSQDLSIDSQSRVYNKQLFMQTLSQLSTYQDLPQSSFFKKASINKKSNLIDILNGQDPSTVEALDISNLELVSLEDQPAMEEMAIVEMINASNNLFMNVSDFLRFNSLTYLDLSNNQISSIYCIDMLPNIKTLILKDNKLDNIEPLSGCNKLKTLDISNNKLSHLFECLNTLKQLKKLRKLNIAGNPLCMSYLYKHETLLQLRGLESLNDEKITEADYEISEKIKQKYFEVEEKDEKDVIKGNRTFAKKLRNLADTNKNEIDHENNKKEFDSEIQIKNQEIENLKQELINKEERIKYLESELAVEKSIVKAYEIFKLENQELKTRLDSFTSNFNNSECNSYACKEKYLLLMSKTSMYIDEIKRLKGQLNDPSLPHSQSVIIDPNAFVKKPKEFEIRKQKRCNTATTLVMETPPTEINMPTKPYSLNDTDDITDNDLEEFLRSTLTKLDEAKSLLKEIPTQKSKEILAPSKNTILLAKKFGQKKNLNFLKDKKLTHLPKPL